MPTSMNKINTSLYAHFGMLLFSIFNEWQEYVEENRGHIPQSARPVLEAVYVDFYLSILDPEISLEASALDQIPSHYIENSTVIRNVSFLMDSQNSNRNFTDALTDSAKQIVDSGTSIEIDYVVEKLNKLVATCQFSQNFIHGIGYSSIGCDIMSFISRYRFTKGK